MAEKNASCDVNAPSLEPLRPCVRFNPGLSDQRQIFLLDVLREHNPISVLDIGCGEGALLEAVCRPSFALPEEPDFDTRHGISDDVPLKCPEDVYGSLNVQRIAGVDISDGLLERAIEAVKAIDDSSSCDIWSRPRPRWTPVDIKLWSGGLQHFNPELRNYDVVLSSEVIEHLPQHILDCFCPMILGRYAPRILAITTPGYEFNQLFTSPTLTDANDHSPPTVREGGYLDPTGRTLRVFRHQDHKFEWTRFEFRDWCTSNASSWGYSVVISGVGRSTVRDPWGRDEPEGNKRSEGARLFASQTAIFTRLLGNAEEHRHKYESRAIEKLRDSLVDESERVDQKPQLFTQHMLRPHADLSSDNPPPSHDDILQEVKQTISKVCSHFSPGEADIWDIWNVDTVSLACQGRLDQLYKALEAAGIQNAVSEDSADDTAPKTSHMDGEWEWVEPEKRSRWTRRIRWHHYTPIDNDELSWSFGDVHGTEQLDSSSPGWPANILTRRGDEAGLPENIKNPNDGEIPMEDQETFDSWGLSETPQQDHNQQGWGIYTAHQESIWEFGKWEVGDKESV